MKFSLFLLSLISVLSYGCHANPSFNDDSVNAFRIDNDIGIIPQDWIQITSRSKKTAWRRPNGYVLDGHIPVGYVKKTIDIKDELTRQETDEFYSGSMVDSRDPDTGQIVEKIYLIYTIKNGEITEKRAFRSGVGTIPFEEARKQAEEWSGAAQRHR